MKKLCVSPPPSCGRTQPLRPDPFSRCGQTRPHAAASPRLCGPVLGLRGSVHDAQAGVGKERKQEASEAFQLFL